MAITNTNPDGIRVTTAAANSTLGSQAAAASNEIIFPDTIAGTNNGNLEASPTYVARKVIVRQGAGDEETKYITAIDGGGTTATVNEDWVVAPVSTDTYHVSYRLADAETVGAQVNLNSKTGVYEFSRNFTVGNSGGGGFAYFAFTDYPGMEMDDSGALDDFTVDADGRCDIGYLQGGAAISGAVILSTKSTAGEPYMNFIEGAEVRAYAGIFWSQVEDTFMSNPATTAGNIDFRNCTFIKTSYTAQFDAQDMTNTTWQGAGDSTNDTFRITSNTNIDTIILANTAGFTSLDDTLTEALEVRNCTFVGNSVNVTVHDDKSWRFVNPKLWTANSTFIAFQVDDLNKVERLFSLDITVSQPDGTAINLAETYVYEGTINSDLPTANRVASDTNGLASSDVLTDLYTFPGSVFTTVSYGAFAVKVYSYTFDPYVAVITADYTVAGLKVAANIATDTNITETTQATAITNGSGIVISKHATGETDPRPLKVIHYDTGTGGLPIVGETITEGSATGVVVEYLGDAVEGYLVLETWNGTEFTNNQTATGGTGTFSAATDTTGGGSSFYQEYTWEVDSSSLAMTAVYDYCYAKISEATPDAIWLNVIEWGEGEQSNLVYVGTSGYKTERNVNLTEGVWISNRGTGTVAYMTSDAGVQFIPPASYSFTLTGLKAGSEIRLYNASTNEEINGVESSSTSFTHTYTYTGDITMYVVIFALAYKDIRLTGLTLSNTNQSIPIQQQVDRVYSNP